jgi:hypothetical protein
VTAFRNAALVTMRDGFRSSHTMETMRWPQRHAMRLCSESTAGMLMAPGSDRPMASAMAVMVLAVPMVLQVPGVRVMRDSSRIHSAWSMLPTVRSAQNFLVCVPAPTAWPL